MWVTEVQENSTCRRMHLREYDCTKLSCRFKLPYRSGNTKCGSLFLASMHKCMCELSQLDLVKMPGRAVGIVLTSSGMHLA